jgi:hypothetical protein
MLHDSPAAVLPTRHATAGGTRITVVDVDGEIVAIVKDRLRGTVRITLGTVQPPARRACCD